MNNSFQLDKSVLTTNSPIGVFDSGIGGLTVVDCIKEQLPNEQLIYIADNLHAPYGDKSDDFIIERVNHIAAYFISQHVKAIVVACNTATAVAIDQLRAKVNIPIIGVEPAIKPAVQTSKTQKIAILTTQATAQNKRFNTLVTTFSPNAISSVESLNENTRILIQPCPGLVEQIEQGQITSAKTRELLLQYLEPLQKQEIDTLVLGCTHYPMLKAVIRNILGDNVCLLDTGLPVAIQLKKRLNDALLLNDNASRERRTNDKWLSTLSFSNTTTTMFPYSWLCINV